MSATAQHTGCPECGMPGGQTSAHRTDCSRRFSDIVTMSRNEAERLRDIRTQGETCPECGADYGHTVGCSGLNAGAEVERLRESLVIANGARLEADRRRDIVGAERNRCQVNLEHWRQEVGKLHGQVNSLRARVAELEAKPDYNRERELGRRVAAAENERDEARAEAGLRKLATATAECERDAMRERCAKVCEYRASLHEVHAGVSNPFASEARQCAAAIRGMFGEDTKLDYLATAGPERVEMAQILADAGEQRLVVIDVLEGACTGCGALRGHEDWCSVKAALDSLDERPEDAPDSHQEPSGEDGAS